MNNWDLFVYNILLPKDEKIIISLEKIENK